MANPKLVGGKFKNCPDGWGCRIVNDNLIRAFNLEDSGIEVFNHGSGETLATSMAAAYENEEPWFGYYWGPTPPLGMTKRQKLFNVQIPLALPHIMAGVNQTIMMSLAMVVIASLVTAPGLGVLVLRGIRSLELGVVLLSGLGIVLLALILDRVTKAALDRINVSQSR